MDNKLYIFYLNLFFIISPNITKKKVKDISTFFFD